MFSPKRSNGPRNPFITYLCDPAARAERMERICWATTDNTSMLIRLNSSKQPHAPVYKKKTAHLLSIFFNIVMVKCDLDHYVNVHFAFNSEKQPYV